MKPKSLFLSVLLIVSMAGTSKAGGGSHSEPHYIVPEPTVTTEQTPDVAHSCKKNLHTANCVEHCKKNLTTAQTPGVVHPCKKDVHVPRCVKKCVIKTTEVAPTGPPPIRSVRGGTAFPVRNQQAENKLLEKLYSKHSKESITSPDKQ